MVMVGCILILGANYMIFKEAAAKPNPLPPLEGVAVISFLWMFAGASGICMRLGWGRAMALTILYLGSIGFFVTIIITVCTDDGTLVGRLTPIVVATIAYTYVSLVFTHSRHVKRLTSRVWD